MSDNDLMPFGKYKGVTLENVPANYFHWLWFEAGVQHNKHHKLHDYISDNIDSFRQENKDLIWS